MGGTTKEGQGLVNTNRHDVVGFLDVIHTSTLLAWEVGAVCRKGAVVDGGLAVRRGSIHDHMSARDSKKRGGKGHKSVDSGRHCVNAVGIVPDEVLGDFGKTV
jgi:hypothetical protein